jgi:hypothetical protein
MTPNSTLPTLDKFPAGSTNRDYDVFEQLPDGSVVWRACVIGMANVEQKLQELAKDSNGRFFALNLQDRKPITALGTISDLFG